uniref:Uncharacterized protein n=1 Tax=Rhodococcus sp. NS1 TaxID=402236 RepID=A0A097SPX7_9NOCA|nr:hypothetical protein LRS1606.149 [Rhodococcus sp. NS1]
MIADRSPEWPPFESGFLLNDLHPLLAERIRYPGIAVARYQFAEHTSGYGLGIPAVIGVHAILRGLSCSSAVCSEMSHVAILLARECGTRLRKTAKISPVLL